MTDRHKIRNEVIRRIESLKRNIGCGIGIISQIEAYESLLHFIDSMQGKYIDEDVTPITAQILEDNGFEFHDNTGAYFCYAEESYSNQTIEIILFHVNNKDKNIQLHIGDEYAPYLHLMECNYVHELQNALNLCKIKKEIVVKEIKDTYSK